MFRTKKILQVNTKKEEKKVMIMKIAKKITLWYIAKQKKYASGYKSGIKYIDSINAAYQFFDTSYFQNNGKGLCLPDYELITSYDMKYFDLHVLLFPNY